MSDKEKFLGRIAIYSTLAVAIISVGGLLWSFSSNSTKAAQAYAFVEVNHNLPTIVRGQSERIERIDRRLCSVERLATSVEKLNGNIGVLSSQIVDLRRNFDRRDHQ